MPAKKEIIEQEDISELLLPYRKLYLICDRLMPGTVPVLDTEGRALCFTDSFDAEVYAQRLEDAQARVFDPMGLTEQAMKWRFLGINKFMLCTETGHYDEHTRAELLGRHEKSFLNSEYNHLQIRLKLAWKYNRASRFKKKYAIQQIDYGEKAKLIEYELHSFMSHEMLFLLPLSISEKNSDFNRNTLIISPNAYSVLSMKGISPGSIGQVIYGGGMLRAVEKNVSLSNFKLISLIRKSDNLVFVPYFIDMRSFEKTLSGDDIVPILISFSDLLYEIESINEKKNESDKKVRPMIDPDGLSEYCMTLEKARIIGVTGQDTIPEHIRRLGGKHVRINITGGKKLWL